MSLAEAVARNAFELTTDPVALAKAHADLGKLTGERVEAELYQALAREDAACAAEVVGPTGSGKSSCIMRVVSAIASRGSSAHEVLILSAGDAASTLSDPAAFAHHLVDVIKSQGFRFATEVQDALRDAGADEIEQTDAVRTHTVKVEGGAPFARGGYQGALQQAHDKRKFGANAAQGRQDLESILKVMRDSAARPVVVIDDTDRFVDDRSATIERDTVDSLFENGVRLLDELKVDFVIAVHPRFDGTAGYETARSKFLRTRVVLPFLRLDGDVNPLSAILGKHLAAHDVAAPVGQIVSDQALDVLYGVYATDRDLREVLATTEDAAAVALRAGHDRIEAEHVSEAMQARAAGR